jgi:hypothetical protein
MRRSLVAATTGLVLVAALAGCSSNSTGTPAPASSAAGSSSAAPSDSGSVEAWADDYCGAALLLKDPPNPDTSSLSSSDPAAAHKAIDKILTDFETYFRNGIDAFNKLGPSPDPAGDDAKNKVVGLLQPVADSVHQARTKLEAASTTDTQALVDAGQAMQDVGTKMSSVDSSFGDLKGSPALNDAYQNAPNCKKLNS